ELQHASSMRNICVLVGAPSKNTEVQLSLAEAYRLAQHYAADLLLGGVAIAERHAKSGTEQMRMLSKADRGCRFFVTQAVYDVSSTKSLLSDYALAAHEKGALPLPVIITLSPCGAPTTLEFMKWLGITFPRWLENELRLARDPLATSLTLCERIFEEVWDYAREKHAPVGVN